MAVSQSSLTGAAGEYLVMSHLLRRGFIAALAPAGVPNCDIVVTDEIGDRLCAIQVKTRNNKGADGGWHMGRKHEHLTSATLFYCFVDLGAPDAGGQVFIVPSRVVANVTRISHEKWLATPGRFGQPHKDGDMRRFLPSYAHLGLADYSSGWLEPYCHAWNLLKRAAD